MSPQGILGDPEKTSTVNMYAVPKNSPEVKSFLGVCSHCERCEQDFAKLAHPQHQLTENLKEFPGIPKPRKHLKISRRNSPRPNFGFCEHEKTFILYTESSQHAMGAVFAHVQNGSERPNCYASKSLTKVQNRYSNTKREI